MSIIRDVNTCVVRGLVTSHVSPLRISGVCVAYEVSLFFYLFDK